MPNVTSSLGTTQPFIPLINATELGKAGGLAIHVASMSALVSLVGTASPAAGERGNIAQGQGLWQPGQPITVAGEPSSVRRVWTLGGDAASSHARSVVIRAGLVVTLPGDSNTVLATTGAPSAGTGQNGDLAVDYAGNTYYLRTGGAWVSQGVIYSGSGGALDLSQPWSAAGALVTPANAMGALVVDVTKALNTRSLAASSTLTFSGTPAAANTTFAVFIQNTGGTGITITFPSARSVVRQAVVSSVFVPPTPGQVMLQFRWDGSVYHVMGDLPFNNNYSASANPAASNDITQGYGPGSLWFNATASTTWLCRSSAAGAAVWVQVGGGGGGSSITGPGGTMSTASDATGVFGATGQPVAIESQSGLTLVGQQIDIQPVPNALVPDAACTFLAPSGINNAGWWEWQNSASGAAVFRAGQNASSVSGVSFFGEPLATRQAVTGSRGGNAALASLLTALAAYGIITNNTTA